MTSQIEQQQEQKVPTGRVFSCPGPPLADKDRWTSLGEFVLDRLSNIEANLEIFIDFESGRVWRPRELKVKILNVACALVDLYDFKRGTAVCISYDKSDLTFILALGVIVAGGIVSCIYPKDPYAELLYMARKVEPKFLFCHQRSLGWAKQLEADLGHPVHAIVMSDVDHPREANGDHSKGHYRHFIDLFNYDHTTSSSSARLPVACEDITRQAAVIVMSSGTTGKPKAVPASHWNCIAEICATGRPLAVRVHLACCASLDYISGRIIAFGAINGTYSAVIMNGFEPRTMLEAIQKFKIQVIYLGGASFYNLITYKDIDNYDISSVRVIFPMGAKIIYLDELRQFMQKHPHIVEVKQGFGASETSGAALRGFSPEEYLKDSENCGPLFPGVRAKIVDPESGRALDVNQEGILHLSGPTVFPGYYDVGRLKNSKDQEDLSPFVADSTVFDEDGFYITGDLAYFNDKEELNFIGRKKELMFCRSAKKVFPQELEEVIDKHPGVSKVCVLGIASKRDLIVQCPRAFVVPRPECYHDARLTTTERLEKSTDQQELTYSGNNQLCSLLHMRQLARDLMDFVNDRVAWEKQLTGGIVILDEIPTSRATGKFNKNYLRSLTTEQVEIYGDQSS